MASGGKGTALRQACNRLARQSATVVAQDMRLLDARWQRLVLRLNAADCERLLQCAARRQLVIGGSRWVSTETATAGWALSAGAARLAGAAWSAGAGAAWPAVAGDAAAQPAGIATALAAARPGNTRSRGSQKLAS